MKLTIKKYGIWGIVAALVILTFPASSYSNNNSKHSMALWNSDTLENQLFEYVPQFDFIPEDEDYLLVADRLSCIETPISLTFNTRVYAFVNYFSVIDRDYTRMVISRTSKYFPIMEEVLAKYGLPDELKYLSIVESGLHPRAISRVGAGGLWQFMPYTGRSYGLHQDFYIDERFDEYKSTEAACKYLKLLYNMFGDWELALAAYNSGPGNVRKAIRRSGYKKNFWEIYRYLPRETRSYVPQFIAITYVLKYAEEYNLNLDLEEEMEHMWAFDTLMVDSFLNLQILAEELNICYEDLDRLNPAVKRFAIPDAVRKYPIRIPEDMISYARENRTALLEKSGSVGKEKLEQLARNTSGSTYGRERVVYRVKSGDVLGTIAQRYRVRVSDLRKWNNINGNLIRVGQRLNIWVLPGRNSVAASSKAPLSSPSGSGPTSISPSAANRATAATGQVHYVQPGDTLWDISRMYENMSVEKLKELNKLSSNKITPGQKLLLSE